MPGGGGRSLTPDQRSGPEGPPGAQGPDGDSAATRDGGSGALGPAGGVGGSFLQPSKQENESIKGFITIL